MALGVVWERRERTRQPSGPMAVRRGDPLFSGLRFAITNGVDALNKSPGTRVSGLTFAARLGVAGEYVNSAIHDGTGYLSFPTNERYNILGPLTLAWYGTITSFANYRMMLTRAAGSGGASNPFELRTEVTSGGLNLLRATAGGFSQWRTTVGVSSGVPLCVIVTQGGNLINSTDTSFMVNGVNMGFTQVSANVSGNATGNSEPLLYGTRADGLPMLGDSFLAYGWDRVLSDAEKLRLVPDRWRAFEAPRSPIFYSIPSSGAAALEAAPTISVTATGGLTTAIQVLGAAVVQAAAAGDLATAIQLAGAAQAGVVAEGSLLTSIDLSGAAVSATLAAGDLSAQIRLDGAALAAALAAAGLTTSIDLAGAAAGAAQATGDITTVIRLSGDAVAAVLATGELTAPGSGLEGHATGGASATGELTTQIPLAGGATVSVIAAGDLATTVSLAGAAVGIVSATGDLVIALSLSGDAIVAALAGASLTTSISMLGAAVATAQAGGTLAGTVYKASARRTHVAARRIRTHVAPDRHRTYMAPRRVRNAIAGLL